MPGRFGNGCGEGFPTIVSKPVPCLKGRKKAGPYRPCFFMQEGLAASAVIVAATAAVIVVAATAAATKAVIATAAYQQEDDDQDPTAVSTKTVHKRTSLKLLYCILCRRTPLCYKL